MKRDEVKALIPEVTDEQLKALLDINTADIGRAKGDFEDLQVKYNVETKTRAALEAEIQTLKDESKDSENLKIELAKLQKEITDRAEEEKQAILDKAFADRFSAIIGEKKFINEFTQGGVLNEFKAALADKANQGKSDADIFATITKDREGLFVNPNTVITTPGTNGKVTLPGAATNEELSKMNFEEYKAFRNGKKE